MSMIVACIVFTSTEVVSSKVPLDFFESYGFYTYLYSVSVAFMLYLFFYVLRVKYYGKARGNMFGSQHKEDDFDVGDFIRRMSLATGFDVKEVNRIARFNNLVRLLNYVIGKVFVVFNFNLVIL